MAVFTMKVDDGLAPARGQGLTDKIIADLVVYTATHVPWNSLGSPNNFGKKTTVETKKGQKIVDIYTVEKTGVQIEFKAGFLMNEIAGDQQKWEGQALSGGFRLDLQNIEGGYANFSIQTNGANSKTIAKCMMEVHKSFSQNQLFRALKGSAMQRMTCDLTFTPRPKRPRQRAG